MVDLIKVVWINKSNGQKCVTIPKSSNIKVGDAVEIIKLEEYKNDRRTDEREDDGYTEPRTFHEHR